MSARLSAFAVGLAALLGGVAFEGTTGNTGVKVVFLSVGQGDCTVLMSDDRTVVVDVAASTEDFDAGERLVVPGLRRLGVKTIDCLVLTHPDLDHVGGLLSVAGRFRIGRVVVSQAFRNDPEMLKALGEAGLRESQVEWLDGSARAQIGELSLFIVAPAWFEGIEANEASLFVRVDVGGASLAMTGDANSTVEDAMSSVGDWDVDLLKAGHHGSRHSTSTEWLEETSPSFVVVSCGRRNPYGHPAVQMQQRVREHGSRLMRTDRDGTIVFVPRGDEFVLAKAYR